MLAADSYFEIGTSHLVCQDYALAGIYKDMAYGIVSDGCSSAKYSEIGAQILCHVTRYYLTLYYDLFREGNKLTLLSLLGNSVLKRADEIRNLYPITRDALQASLFVSVMIGERSWVFGWGDGVLIMKRDGSYDVYELEYPDTNAPFYLVTDRQAYIDKFGPDRMVRYRSYRLGSEEESTLSHEFYAPLFDFSEGIESITICTDGVTQYLDEFKKPMPAKNIIPHIIDYPSTTGVFVQRTMNFLKRDFARKGWSHADDIGMATIIRSPDEEVLQ